MGLLKNTNFHAISFIEKNFDNYFYKFNTINKFPLKVLVIYFS